MNYVVTVNGEKYEVEVERVGGGTSSLSRRPPERVSRPVQAAPAAQPVATPQSAAPAPAAPAASGGAGTVVSPMPGTVLDVRVKEGDAVSIGQVVVILEAMKMETEIVSEVAGSVAAVRVKKGDAVDTDTVLVEVK